MKQVSKLFDDDGSGSIEYAEFLNFCEAGSSELAIDGLAEASKRKKKKKKKAVSSAPAKTAGVSSGPANGGEEFSDIELMVRKPIRETSKQSSDMERISSLHLTSSISSLQSMLENLHSEMNRLAKSKYGPPKFRKVFQTMDKDGSGQCDLSEFVDGLAEMG